MNFFRFPFSSVGIKCLCIWMYLPICAWADGDGAHWEAVNGGLFFCKDAAFENRRSSQYRPPTGLCLNLSALSNISKQMDVKSTISSNIPATEVYNCALAYIISKFTAESRTERLDHVRLSNISNDAFGRCFEEQHDLSIMHEAIQSNITALQHDLRTWKRMRQSLHSNTKDGGLSNLAAERVSVKIRQIEIQLQLQNITAATYKAKLLDKRKQCANWIMLDEDWKQITLRKQQSRTWVKSTLSALLADNMLSDGSETNFSLHICSSEELAYRCCNSSPPPAESETFGADVLLHLHRGLHTESSARFAVHHKLTVDCAELSEKAAVARRRMDAPGSTADADADAARQRALLARLQRQLAVSEAEAEYSRLAARRVADHPAWTQARGGMLAAVEAEVAATEMRASAAARLWQRRRPRAPVPARASAKITPQNGQKNTPQGASLQRKRALSKKPFLFKSK